MSRREPLNREKILDAALTLAAEEGLEGLSMRRLAKSLGVEAMSLYNHVSNKADILDGLAERVFSTIERPDPSLPWPEQIRVVAGNMYHALARHPVVPLALVTDQSNPTSERALAPLDGVVGALYQAGFDDVGVWRALGAVNALVFGSLMLSTGGFTGDSDEHVGRREFGAYVREVDPARLPHFSRLLKSMPEVVADPARDFEKALDLLIRGLVEAAPATPRP
ncbi:TetR/AcrR family transcriptional regulator C-terminal domain-containing protein [Nonomuraea mangrovi]|uniref:TetR/AcrR family transcriptional regulator C-terminal domain-containing protein n=1 Tax=Nonomuraea mangrovi TaxID=2316207 RepID=A0ABW4TET4_9ACTN